MKRFLLLFWLDLVNQFYVINNIRRYLAESRALVVKSAVVGVAVSLIIVLLREIVEFLLEWTFSLPEMVGTNVIILLPLLTGAILVAALSHFTAQSIPYIDDHNKVHNLPDIEGDGIERALALYASTRPTVIHALRAETGLANRWRYHSLSLVGRKVLATISTVGLGGSGGLEASSVLIGEAVAAGLFKPQKRLLKGIGPFKKLLDGWYLDQAETLQTLQLCGIAAAISTLVGTPLMAAFFATEVIYRRTTIYNKFFYTLIASVTAHVTALLLGVGNISIEVEVRVLPPLTVSFFLVVILTSIVVTLVSLLYSGINHAFNRVFKHVHNVWLRFAIGAWLTGVLALITVWLSGGSLWLVLGTGETLLYQLLNGQVLISVTLLALFTRMLATSLTISSGGSAGLLVPSLVFGAMVANIFATLFGQPVVPLAAAAMAASLVALVKVPISSLIFVSEAFGASYIFPAVVALIISSLLAYDNSIYRTQRDVARWQELAPGYSLRRVPVSPMFADKTIRELDIQHHYHINVIGMVHPDDRREIAPEPDKKLATGDELVVVGPNEAVHRFAQLARHDMFRHEGA
ncbi:MAG: chloride channel protein [Anaerolineae bacterium]|nr:chloride channel protein [Anaerolineae bacterium]